MSFKRADDDSQAWNRLRRRRVDDLLGEEILDDEVSRLSNGRLVCMVCNHRPIFDTLDVYYIHRQGKKHQTNTEYKAAEKQELQDLIAKRKHEQFLKTGKTNIQQAVAEVPKGLGGGKPYDPRTKKRPNPHERKTKLDINTVTEMMTDNSSMEVLETTNQELLPGNREDINFKRKPRIDLKSKNTSETGTKYSKVFNKQQQNLSPGDNNIVQPNKIRKLVENNGLNQDVRHHIARRQKLKADIANKIEIGSLKRTMQPESSTTTDTTKSAVDWQKFQQYKAALVSGTSKTGTKSHKQKGVGNRDSKIMGVDNQCLTKVDTQSGVVSETKSHKQKEVGNIDSKIMGVGHQSLTKVDTQSGVVSESSQGTSLPVNNTNNGKEPSDTAVMDKRAKAEKELQLRGAGWKRDWTGTWVRDEDAEFDSDEETPDLP